ncbi:solute carrier family 35 member F6 [Biomphalaria glabrata]|nr:solute carrier family 35 member F6 [Biomphalaria glabrata]
MTTKGSVLIGLAFVFVGLILVLSDRWPENVNVIGTKTRKAHKFDHLFLLWFIKQFLQLLLLPLWFMIEKNVLGFGVFKHGGLPQRVRRDVQMRNVNAFQDENNDNAPNQGEGENQAAEDEQNQNDQALLLHRNPPRQLRSPSKLIYFPAAFFAQASVLLLYFGLKLTYGSSFIMLKGTVAFFTALLAMAFLAQQLACYVWFGVVVTTLGFAVSGISDYIHVPNGGYEKYGIAAGDLLIVMSQIMFATKIIYEEKFIRKHSIHPMLFLGAEATYGFVFAGLFLILFNLLDLVQYSYLPNGRMEDIVDAWNQLRNSWQCSLAFSGSIVFYILYTYLGMFLIRDHGALPRIMIESIIWALYWAVCLALDWETFFIAQVPGLCIVPIGVLIYSHILVIPFVSCGQRGEMRAQDFIRQEIEENQGEPEQDRDGNGHAGYQEQEGAGENHPVAEEDVRLLDHQVEIHAANGDDLMIEG